MKVKEVKQRRRELFPLKDLPGRTLCTLVSVPTTAKDLFLVIFKFNLL